MKTKLFTTVFLFSILTNIYGQDLIPSSGTIAGNTSLYTSDLFDITFQIKNNGSYTSACNYVGIRISQSNNYNTAQMISLGYVSVEQLSPYQVSSTTEYKLPLPYTITSGTYYVYIIADNFNAIPETNENNNIGLLPGTIQITKSYSYHKRQNIPYPILFVHGWLGDDCSWRNDDPAHNGIGFADSVLNKQYGWSDGGTLDFCLNADNDLTTGELYNDFHDYVSVANLSVGDYYFINFDIDADGNWWDYSGASNDQSESNQAAVVKQGYAIKKAIGYILNITGADKVILAGHSMGGLACREYLQRWSQSDGLSHVAKLFTCGTPNQGSDATAFGLPSGGKDEKSEAVRDLRRSYYESGTDGAYLFGGIEDNAHIQNNIAFPYHNVDVNCNGIVGEIVSGLDYENSPADINYSCVIGTGDPSVCPGTGTAASDGVVEDWSSNLQNGFLNASPAYIDSFVVNANQSYDCWGADFLHLHLEKAEYGMYDMMALDEPDVFDFTGYGHAYDVDFNKLYYGTITPKNKDPFNADGKDYDDYKFVVSATSNITFNVYNVNIPDMQVQVYDGNKNAYSMSVSNNGKGNISFALQNVPAGTYYLQIRGTANISPSTWYRAYGFQITNSTVTNTIEQETSFLDMNIFPNPSNGKFNVNITSDHNKTFKLEVLNTLGEKVYSSSEITKGQNHKINIEELPDGIYIIKATNSDQSVTKNIIINK